MRYEVGVRRASVVTMMYRAAADVWNTWRFARAKGLPANEWFGVYEAGTNNVMAACGPLPGAHERADKICRMLEQK